MRPSRRLFATVKSAAKYLEADAPTGLTGLNNHPYPRPALLYTYNQTLKKLQQIPSSSVYRQSTEALTKQRLAIVEATKPPGYDEWKQRVTKAIEANPEAYSKLRKSDGSLAHEEIYADPVDNWDGKFKRNDSFPEGSNSEAEANRKAMAVKKEADEVERQAKEGDVVRITDLELEPPLTADQVSEMENKIGAGLIEEVVQVAEGELLLVDEMVRARAWEDLEEKSPPGQWSYFERGDVV